jgi:hypothetical protein
MIGGDLDRVVLVSVPLEQHSVTGKGLFPGCFARGSRHLIPLVEKNLRR